MESKRMEILRRLEAGEIGAEEAAALLAAEAAPVVEEPGEVITAVPTGAPPDRWTRFWVYPLMAGGVVLIVGSLLMALVYSGAAARGWLACGWPLLIGGLVAALLALWSRSARWLHLRVREAGGRRIAFSFPVPLTLLAWSLRVAQPFAPQLRETGIDDLIIALRDSRRGEPLSINVDDGEKGDRVELYLG